MFVAYRVARCVCLPAASLLLATLVDPRTACAQQPVALPPVDVVSATTVPTPANQIASSVTVVALATSTGGSATGCCADAAGGSTSVARRRDAAGRQTQRATRYATDIWGDTETPRVTRPVARHRERSLPWRPVRTFGSATVDTPRSTCSRVTTADGRSPGSRVATFRRLPGTRDPSGLTGGRFAADSCGGSRGLGPLSARTAFPFDPRGEPSRSA